MQLLGVRAWCCLLSFCLLGIAPAAHAQKPSERYLQRAETMYATVWQQYQVVGEPGLLAENYPANRVDSLTYMQGGRLVFTMGPQPNKTWGTKTPPPSAP